MSLFCFNINNALYEEICQRFIIPFDKFVTEHIEIPTIQWFENLAAKNDPWSECKEILFSVKIPLLYLFLEGIQETWKSDYYISKVLNDDKFQLDLQDYLLEQLIIYYAKTLPLYLDKLYNNISDIWQGNELMRELMKRFLYITCLRHSVNNINDNKNEFI